MSDSSPLRRRGLACTLLVLAGVCAPSPAVSAQENPVLEVRGRFLASPDDAPLAGAYVTLLDGSGRVRASTLTNGSGWFALPAPGPGRYTVQAENIGYATAGVTVELTGAGPALVELRSSFQPIELEGITAEVGRGCEVPRETAARVAELWDEVRKAFRVTAFAEERSAVLFEVDRWTRTLEPNRLRVQEETRRPRTGLHPGSPFVSLPPERLAAEGYVQGGAGSDEVRYFGPDARVLLDRSFQDAHCFGFTDDAPEDGWVGLRFRPRDPRAADIEGTLWIDAASYAPRRLEFRYTRLPWPITTDKVGGRLDFGRLPEGPWIVERWWIRMPVVQDQSFRSVTASRERRYGLAALIEEGGEVRRARTNEREILTFAMGTVEGTVRDSVSGTPLEGARVLLEGTFFQATTDSDGRFRFTDVPRGRYAVAATPPGARAGAPPEARIAEADVAPDAVTSLHIRVSAPDPAPAVATGSETLLVRVLAPNGREAVEGAEVALPALGRSLVTDASGAAYFAGVPAGPTELRIEHLAYFARVDTLEVGGNGATSATVRLSDRAVELRPIVVEVLTPEAVEARARGSSGSVRIGTAEIREAVEKARADNVAEVIRHVMPTGLRVSPMVRGDNYAGTCIESTRGAMQYRKLRMGGEGSVCAMVQVVLDGAYLTTLEAARLVESFPLLEIASMEFLSPTEQSFRYGSSDPNGMLIIRTAR